MENCRTANFTMRIISLISEYLIIPLYMGNTIIQAIKIPLFITSKGKIFIKWGRSSKRCLTRKYENMKIPVIRIKSQQNMIHLGANLFRIRLGIKSICFYHTRHNLLSLNLWYKWKRHIYLKGNPKKWIQFSSE